MQYQWIKWFNGYLVIILKGKRIERLINLAIQKKMQIWNIARYDQERGKLAIRLEDFFELKPLLKETGCRVRIMSKHGLPFFFKKIKERYAFFAGFVLFITMLFLLSRVIWSIEVVGTEKISKQAVLMEAKELGIEQGKFSFMLDDPDKIQDQLMKKIPEASWIGFQMRGTTAQIRVVEKVIPDPKKAVGPRHLVAKKAAVIANIFAEQGKPVVRPDDFVRKGDVLVSGFIGKEDAPLAVAAKGTVEGEVWYETEVAIPMTQKQVVYTGEKHRNLYIILGNYRLKIWGFGEYSFQEHETKEDQWLFHWRDWHWPLGWKIEDLLETEQKVNKINLYEAQELAKQNARQVILSKIDHGGYIKEEKVLHQRQENDKVYIKMHVISIEDIAIEQPITVEGD